MLLARFKTGFKYELRVMPPPRDVNPLEHFLFQTRTGNCEYFAGALGLMLRAVDVPSRLVEGFMGMEETGDTNEFIVRFSHAHAWVESILEGTHWTTLDPTPPGAFQLPHVVWLWLTDFYDNLEFEWLRGVVNFDRSDQLILLRGISGLFSGQAWSSVPALFQSGSWYLVTAAAAVFVLIAVLIAGTFRIHRKSPSAIYAGTMRAMVRKGILHEAHPWHERNAEEILRNAPSSGKAVAEFMELYLGARFDTRDHTSTADLRQAGRELLKEVSKTA
jgi:hypothetical protein